MKTLAILFLIVLSGCKQRPDGNPIPVNMSDTIVTEKEATEGQQRNEQLGDTINMVVRDEKGRFSAIGQIDSIHPRIYIRFKNEKPVNLKAVINTMEGDGNIRFNQIVFPDKTTDGPFGKEVIQQLSTVGEHVLVIGHSLMAEGRYEGKFKVDLELNK